MKIDFESFVELSDLKGDSYAESLVQTINAALKEKGGNISKVQKLLRTLEKKLLEDERKSERKWRERYSRLNKTIHETELTIDKLDSEIAFAKKRRAELNQRIRHGEVILKGYESQLTQDKNTKRQLMVKRNQDHRIYVENKHHHQNLVLEIEQVITILLQLKDSISGVNKPSHVEAISEEKRDQAYKKSHHLLLQVFSQEEVNSLLQLNTEADQASLGKLINILNNLLKTVRKALEKDEEEERRSIKIYQKLLNRLDNDIKALTKAIKRQNDNLKKYRREVVRLSGEITSKSNLMAKNKQFLAQTLEIRRTEKLKHERDQRQRRKERKTIKKLQKIVKRKLATMKEFLKKRVDN